ncbi:MAG: amino acid permease [Chlamydiae bacterium]|nr:amino acid permease [Chlamydiota bacterium]
MNNKISLFPLILLIVAAIDSIRTLPTTAFFGSSLIFLYLLSSIVFLIPVAFISAEFSSRFPEQGGIFHWVRHAFGDRTGLLAVWLQWINTMVWYPTMLLFIAGTATHLISPSLAYNKNFLLIASLAIFWSLTFLNLKGIKVSVRMNSFCGMIGTLLPMCLLIALGAWWVFSSNSVAVAFSWNDLLPSFDLLDNCGAIVTIMASFLGMELAGVHVSDIENPQKNFPKAIGYSVLILLGTLILGSLAVAIVLPKQDIHFVDGIMQTFTTFLTAFHMPYLIPVLALLIVIGSTGGSVNWLLSPAKGLLQVAEFGFLPSFFSVKNKHGVPFRILVLQAILVSTFSFFLQFVPNVNTYYWFLMSLSTGLYMLMYILLFLAALKLKRPEKSYRIPHGVRTISCLAGLCACAITIIIGFQLPSNMVIENKITYVLMIVGGFSLMILPVTFFWLYQKKRTRSNYSPLIRD